MYLSLNTNLSCVDEKEFSKQKNLKNLVRINTMLHSGKEEWTKWVDYPSRHIKHLNEEILIAEKIKKDADVLIVLGIGGSYLGALAGLTALGQKSKTKIEFAGINFSYQEIETVFAQYKDKNVYVNVISKSGTTTETMLAFEYSLKFLKSKYGKTYLSHLVITTDANKGYLREFANKNGVLSLVVPDDIGGRYSVLTAVGSLPFLVAGLDMKKMLKGALSAETELADCSANNLAYRYALVRLLLNKKGKKVEVLSSFYPSLSKIGSWWTQLFAESEGKDKKGLFVTNLNFSTDLHSVGQFIQQGSPILFETFLSVNKISGDGKLQKIANDNPIKYLEGKSFEDVNLAAQQGTIEAHHSANVPILQISLEKIDEEHIGYLFYFFELSCAISGMMLGINPFNQPGVEDYKKNMKKNLLKK